VISGIINEMVAYSQYHFSEEETMMARVGLDPRHQKEHIEIHADFCRSVTEMLSVMSLDNAALANKLLKFLVHWLACHILGTDQAMARQIHAIEAGQTPEAAYIAHSHVGDGAMEPMLRALNGLFHEVSERNRELMELNRSLEAKVEERTRSLAEANNRLKEIALTDALTGLPNRRHALGALQTEWADAVRLGMPLSVMMVDADGFKQINDTQGHDAGDQVLIELARTLKDKVRNDDLVCRLGGDEFLVICPATPLPGALQVAENLRRTVAALRVPAGAGEWRGGNNIGVAVSSAVMRSHEDLVKAADNAVYESKRNGRNRVSS
jgi:diguanylate cyclase (GGDEF)-like protein/hemerythrin-like metal-binding protein